MRETDREAERERKKFLGVMKRREQFLQYYHKLIRQTPRLYFPLICFLRQVASAQPSPPPPPPHTPAAPLAKKMGEIKKKKRIGKRRSRRKKKKTEGIRGGWMLAVGGPVSYNRETNRRALLGACRAPGARLQYHVTHSAAKIKHVRTLLTAAASGTTITFFPAPLPHLLLTIILLPPVFSFFRLLLIRVKRVPPLNWTLSQLCSDNDVLRFSSFI